ncbi:MAG: SDR family oxidoreductase, partial [Kiritimatiellaeota bacterium]|nr:SDR family oxidoreductase [Kiritimatiellota bacterium]
KTVPGSRVAALRMDIANEQSIKEVVGKTVEKFGNLNIMVNATTVAAGKLVEELSGDEFDATLHVNLTGAFILARESAAHMQSGGNIIMFSSMYGRVSPDPRIYIPPMTPNPVEYGVAKGGLDQMIRYLAVHWGPRNIRVNGVCPGPFPNANIPDYAKDPKYAEFVERLAKKVPLGRVGRQGEMAGAVVFLASDEAAFVTGHILVVDGGWTIW